MLRLDKPTSILGLLVIWRIFNALSIKTFFQPDEYFQSLEPAWRAAFGPQSGAWITWEWKEHLRSSLHPLIFATAYRLASSTSALLNLGPAPHSQLLLATPKLVQAIFAALGDYYCWRLATRLHGSGSNVSWAALALTVLNPWQWFCSVRTFSNSLETTLTALALSNWPWEWLGDKVVKPDRKNKPKITHSSLHVALSAAAAAGILRPTNLIIWVAIGSLTILKVPDWDHFWHLVTTAAFCGGSVLSMSFAIDWAYFGQAVFPPFKFLYFNIVQSLAVFYGKNRWDYYVTEGLPLLLTTALPFSLWAFWPLVRPTILSSTSSLHRNSKVILASAVLTTIFSLTMIGHKEVRFIYPLLPILLVIGSETFAGFLERSSRVKSGILGALLLANMIIAGYTGFVHQRGVIDVMQFLREEQAKRFFDSTDQSKILSNITVGFLMPCHSTPWRSHLIYPEIKAWALTCEPPLGLSQYERQTYLDEADVFYENPTAWIQTNMLSQPSAPTKTSRPTPEFLVFFEQLEPELKEVLTDTSYVERWRGFNTHWHDDWRRSGDVIVWHLSTLRNAVH